LVQTQAPARVQRALAALDTIVQMRLFGKLKLLICVLPRAPDDCVASRVSCTNRAALRFAIPAIVFGIDPHCSWRRWRHFAADSAREISQALYPIVVYNTPPRGGEAICSASAPDFGRSGLEFRLAASRATDGIFVGGARL
jgi:hypothetical protein